MRRSNKSHKVPNVRLRPAPARVRVPDASCDRSSDSEAPPNASMVDLCPRPFKGFNICATGTMDKPSLFKMAFELGAASTSDFTDRVTHLVANAHGGAKYMCALERKIPILTPDWITEAHAIWLRGDDVDVPKVTTKHRLPIFLGVVLSLSGINDVQRLAEIHRLLTEHQGIYLKNLERPVRVTHLLCSGDTETDKMTYAEKFNKRKEAHIHLVWEEWFWDCLEFGGRFDERKYQVNRPRPERKILHQNPTSSLPAQGSHPDQANEIGSFTVLSNLQIDGEEEEMAIVNKPVPSVTLHLWQSLLRTRGFELNGGKLVKSPSKLQVTQSQPSTPTRTQARPDKIYHAWTSAEHGRENEKESVISSFRRANSFAPFLGKEPAARQPFRRTNTSCLLPPGELEGRCLLDLVQSDEMRSSMQSLFSAYTFRLLGEARCPNVRLAIENGGGAVIDDDADEPSFIIVRLISGSKLYRDELDDQMRNRYRTECWLEHSVFHERICEPDENVSFTPLRIETPVPDAENIKLSLSSLDQSELCWIRRLVRAVGITLETKFSRRSTHLLCPGGEGAKFDKALEWQIPVISLAWLEAIARTGAIPPVDEYLVGDSEPGPPEEALRVPTPAQVPSSTSPSPMKLPPSSSIPDAFAASSPAHLPDPNAIARALHESLTTLLGKRPIEEENELVRAMGATSSRKKGKRIRPGCKISSGEMSRENIISPRRPAPPVPLADVDLSLLDGLGICRPESMEEASRVTYEDPRQVEEKQRLLKLLGEDAMELGVHLIDHSGTGVGNVQQSRHKKVKVSGF